MIKTITQENNNDTNFLKIEFPTMDDVLEYKVKFDKEFDVILLFSQETGTIDTNSYLSKIAFLKNNKIYLFSEYDNPEYASFHILECDESNYFLPEYEHLSSFFKEALNLNYNLKFINKNNKISKKKI